MVKVRYVFVSKSGDRQDVAYFGFGERSSLDVPGPGTIMFEIEEEPLSTGERAELEKLRKWSQEESGMLEKIHNLLEEAGACDNKDTSYGEEW